MSDYQHTASPSTIIRTSDGVFIPTDPANADYAAYLEYVDAGGETDPAPTPPPRTTISAAEFLARFQAGEQIAVQALVATVPQIGFGLTLGLAQGFIVLTSPILAGWMAALVEHGAVTADRATEIMTP